MRRYDRQIILTEMGIEGQQKLQQSSVLIVGAGGLGCPLLLYLAGAGIGHIGVIDDDVVDETNLHRQVLYHMADIGKSKATTAAEKLLLLNPYVNFKPYPYRLTIENATELFAQYDLIVDGSDNFATRYLVNDTCVALNKSLVFGSIFQFEGQVSVFNYKGSPDYRSLYPEPPPKEEVPNCGESGVIGTLPGIIGSIMANEVIKIICGFGEVLSGKLLTFNTLNNETLIFNFYSEFKKPEFPVIKNLVNEIQSGDAIELTISDLETWNDAETNYQLVDVREPYEYEEYNIGGINIPVYSLNTHISQLLEHPILVFCCSSGIRSKIAVNLLRKDFHGEIYTLIAPMSQ
ncbi:HesA/MoeB/ThiF family protein [Pedobacter frigoris]|uniref:Molybdopterin-synthase adenylyltransferase n=1 Tax=Pedobacter frigoris TaxID=2571272 RepID=A0A4U1CKI1_9SPHI|nr:HesA/MoeB/ThiF family protein [Pedobacter frigoris]TKC05929.1 thiamine biosynthesis protein ThiF [Pedobacter frigoris]